MQPFQCDLQPQMQETHRTTHTGTTTRCRTQRRNQNDPSRTRRTQEVPFIAACSHSTRKSTRFSAPASSPKQTKPMQHSCGHYNAFRSIGSQTCTYLRTNEQQSMTTIMPPFQCDLQPQIQEMHRNTHTGTTTRCRTQRRNRNDPSRTRGTQEVPFIASCSHCTRKNTRFRAPASSPKQSPCNIHAAMTLRFAASRG